MPDYAVRITHPYETIAALVSAWAMRSETMAVYEHPKDDKVKRTHCHMIITGTNVDKKQLRNIASKFCDVKGNENCSFKEFTGEERAYVYMTKGVHDPKYLLCIPEITAKGWKASWVPPTQTVKVDKYTKLYQDFIVSQAADMEDDNIFSVKRCARYYVRTVLNMTFTVNAMNIYKMLVRTYCYDEGISIPKDDKLDW